MGEKIKNYFQIDQLHTTVKREILAGFTTFISMAYILFVNPSVLGASGMDKGAVFTATALASALGCFLMGILAKYPIATAPALGINAFFAYSVCIGMKIPWQTALAGVFVASLIFIVITIFKLREMIINAIPADLKYAISSGIGLFIAFIGLHDGGLIVANKSTVVGLGSLGVATTWLTIFGLILTSILMVRRVPGGIFIGMAATAILGLLTGLIKAPAQWVSTAPSLKPTFMVGVEHIGDINTVQLWVVVLTFLLVTFFDTAGTLVGLAQQAGFMKDNKMPRVGKALMSDSTAMLAGSVLGTSPVGAYVESSAGIAVGGRSGLTAVTTGVLFILGLFFSPMLAVVTSQVTAPALIIVGVLMAQSMKHIAWEKMEIAIPAFLILIGMPLTYSVSDGIALGFIMYPITMVAAKRGKEVHPIMYGLFFVFIFFLYILNKG
ncbi:Xanthine/uracil/thiamine/ascorbate permease family protein [Pediococcus damnosus]|uniref:Xanthine/uracil/thiamine/ascorbate permease family protein n=1 Tax=Pediococcus damnosus TaxID=51663 RepID=A0ABM6A325_9LACO|nr:NCS2 family permease [Pediococcus damnosus]AMV60782.1 Xanthine/uracil/thiamine/ascorbate permease family protein [Pediococcus damnosus]AMV65093.1 Xanthine/uracil/thiamine/ascorbate permease family protein [Pediococcus damnosus]AMV66725.1 Xanthine/uracil/thiamine/ascorbate permease family protein [Pediococcus damnosus]KJU74294.1 guanine permease [Pediococcus damnosus LMG 28219]KRN50015.1 transport protein [Pediococcus damnosus]